MIGEECSDGDRAIDACGPETIAVRLYGGLSCDVPRKPLAQYHPLIWRQISKKSLLLKLVPAYSAFLISVKSVELVWALDLSFSRRKSLERRE